jgi:hypothetical protein
LTAEKAHERWLFDVVSALPEFEDDWDDDGLGIEFSNGRGEAASVNIEPGAMKADSGVL